MLRRRRALVVVTVLVALLAGFLITPRDSLYTAKASLYVGSRVIDVNKNTGNVSGDLSYGLSFLANSFSKMIGTRTVAEQALAVSGVDRTVEDAASEITATAEPATQLITVLVLDRDPAVSAALANGVVDSFVELINDQERQQATPSTSGEQVAPVSVFEHAVLPTRPEASGLFQNLVLAMIFGLLVSGGLVVLLEYLDVTIKSADDAQDRLQLPVLGAIPNDPSILRA